MAAAIRDAPPAAHEAPAAAPTGGAGDGVAGLALVDKPHKKEQAQKRDKAPKKDKPSQAPKAKPDDGGGKKKETKLGLSASKASDFGEWYSQVVLESGMISYSDVSGCYILWPPAFSIWESITAFFDGEIKKLGVKNASFPLFVTEEALETEKDHVEGFAAEVAWVTKSGKSELERPIAIRPTSETIIYPHYAQRIRSWRDLPLRLNQWTNVVRWEFKHPTPFIRSREFLWQEGHTAFATKEEADDEVFAILDLYARVYTDLLAVPVCKVAPFGGHKSAAERFAGAMYTTSVEAYVPAAGRGVQGGTSHCLGQNFSRMFGIAFEAQDGSKQLAWQNSWGLSTRSIGVMIMVHGDDTVVVIPIQSASMPEDEKTRMAGAVDDVAQKLRNAGVRVEVDDRDNYRAGWKYNFWELKGVPIRVELGPKDLEAGAAMLVRRDTRAKQPVALTDAATAIPKLLEQIQADMLAHATAEFEASIERATTWDAFMAALGRRHMVLAPWCDEAAVEEDVRRRSSTTDAMGAKTLCLPLEQPPLPPDAVCFVTGKPAKNWALWGRSY